MDAHRDGVDFVLYATEDTRRAIRVVDLFFLLSYAVARDTDQEFISIKAENLHRKFPEFVKSLSLELAPKEECVYEFGPGDFCRAIALYNIAYEQTGSGVREPPIAWILFAHLHPNRNENERNILRRATMVGVPKEILNYEHLTRLTTDMLKQMGVLT